MSIHFGQIRQIGYVVRDIEQAMHAWIDLGVGPWFYVESVPVQGFCYNGQTFELEMSAALANSGNIQIELIQQRNAAPSLYRDFLKEERTGIHHVAYWSEQFDQSCQLLKHSGYAAMQSGTIGQDGRFVYFCQPENPGLIIELSEMSGIKGKYFKAIAEAAATWNGAEPIRR